MVHPEFPSVQPLIASQKMLGGSLALTFRCPDSERAVRAQASLSEPSPGKTSLWSALRRSAIGALSDALGRGVDDAMKGEAVDYSREDVQQAVVAAFESVRTNFRWDPAEKRWFDSSVQATSFQKRLRDMPVTEPADQDVLIRTLLELSKSDGMVSAEELLFIGDFLTPSMGALENMIQKPDLSPDELARTTESARPSIMMLAWACAMCDENLDPAEVARLNEISAGFGLSATESDELRTDAQQFLLRHALSSVYTDGSRDEEAFAEVHFAAEKMGVGAEETAALDLVFREEIGAA